MLILLKSKSLNGDKKWCGVVVDLILILKEVYCPPHWHICIIKERTVHKFTLAFSSPFVCVLYCICWFFSPLGVTQAGDHMTGHPYSYSYFDWMLYRNMCVMICIETRCCGFGTNSVKSTPASLTEGTIKNQTFFQKSPKWVKNNSLDKLTILYSTFIKLNHVDTVFSVNLGCKEELNLLLKVSDF